MAANGPSIRRSFGGTCLRDRQLTRELYRSIMRLQRPQRQKYGENACGTMFITIWDAHNGRVHFGVWHRDWILLSCIDIWLGTHVHMPTRVVGNRNTSWYNLNSKCTLRTVQPCERKISSVYHAYRYHHDLPLPVSVNKTPVSSSLPRRILPQLLNDSIHGLHVRSINRPLGRYSLGQRLQRCIKTWLEVSKLAG